MDKVNVYFDLDKKKNIRGASGDILCDREKAWAFQHIFNIRDREKKCANAKSGAISANVLLIQTSALSDAARGLVCF